MPLDRPITPSDLPGDPREFLEGRLASCHSQIAAAAERGGRSAADVQLLVVTKYVDVDVIRVLYDLGVRDFGENRLQAALHKWDALKELSDARFHFVGHLQRNKVATILEHCAAIHSLDSLRLLEALERRIALRDTPAPSMYVEVNLGEAQKGGVSERDLPMLLDRAAKQPRVGRAVRGLMAMAPRADDPGAIRPHFQRLRELRDQYRTQGLLPPDAGLSMGMSGDFPVAVEEGATVVRIGTVLYQRDRDTE